MESSKITKVGLINPPYTRRVLFYSLPYLLGSLRKLDLSADFKLFDCPAMGYRLEYLFSKLQEYQPDIIGVSVPFTITLKVALHIIDVCKKLFPQAWIVAGGVHASLCPEDLFDKCDYVVIGKGEGPMEQIIRSYQDRSKSRDIAGTVYSDNDKMIIVPKNDENVDSLGSPDWSDVDLTEFFSPRIFGSQEKGFSVFASTGCSFNCTFCSNHLLTHRKVIYRNLDDVVSEIQWFQKKYDINIFSIADEVFTLDKKRVFEFCDILEKRKVDIRWTFQTRANLVSDKKMLMRMKELGAERVTIGIESGNSEVLRINKNISLDQIVDAVDILKSVGFLVYAGFIIGFPEDTIDTVWETITFADKLDLDSPGFQLMVPYPKTKVREKALKEGGILTNDFNKYTTYGVVYVPPGLKKYDLLEIRRFAFQYFHTRTRKRVDNFMKRFVHHKDYEAIKKKYNLMFAQRDIYNKEYLMSLKYSKNASKNEQKIESLPI